MIVVDDTFAAKVDPMETDRQTPSLLRLAKQLDAGDTVFSAWIAQDPWAVQTFAQQGYDTATFDMQHGRIDMATAIQGIAIAAAAGLPTAVRIPVGEYQTAARMLDAGAAAIVAPMINSVDEARRLVDFCKYPPLGSRSFGAYAALAMSGVDRHAFLRTANRFCKLFAMVETTVALEKIADIVAVDGIDGVFVGPADLSIALTHGAAIDANHPLVKEALHTVRSACDAAGKVAGVYALGGDWAVSVARMGYRFVAVSSDVICLAAGAGSAIAAARAST